MLHDKCKFISRRFNRYMVECEFTYDPFKKIVQIVLIDTWWNVNYVLMSFVCCSMSF